MTRAELELEAVDKALSLSRESRFDSWHDYVTWLDAFLQSMLLLRVQS